MIKVFINSRLIAIVNDPSTPALFPLTRKEEIAEAWRIIGDSPFGSCYECHDEHGIIREFISF